MGSISNHWVSVVYDVRVTHPTDNLQYVHKLISSINRDLLGVTLIRVHIEGTGTSINDDTGQILVTFVIDGIVRGIVLGTHGWSVLDSFIIVYLGPLVKRRCATLRKVLQGPLVHNVSIVGICD